MNTLSIASVSVAAVMAIGVLGAAPAEARQGHSFGGGSSMGGGAKPFVSKPFVSKPFVSKPTFTRRITNTPRIIKVDKVPKINKVTKIDKVIKVDKVPKIDKVPKVDKVPKIDKVTKIDKVIKVDKVPKIDKIDKPIKPILDKTVGFRPAPLLGPKQTKLTLAKLPVLKTVPPKLGLVGRVGLPQNFKPKLVLGKVPNAKFKMGFAPFLHRHWKSPFFWVAVAGIGYVTVPELYYDRFYRCAGVIDPDYDECVRVLSYAAVAEEDQVKRVRYSMPSGAVYRYRAKATPAPEVRQSCSFEPFVERKWNREFVWVEIPQTGNVTVPEEIYDKFAVKVDGEPPDYAAACKVLTEAAADDTVVATTAMDLERRL